MRKETLSLRWVSSPEPLDCRSNAGESVSFFIKNFFINNVNIKYLVNMREKENR